MDKVFNGKGDKNLINKVVDDLEEIKKLSGENTDLYKQRTSEYLKDVRDLNRVEKYLLKRNNDVRKANIERAMSFEDPVEGINSMLGGSTKAVVGAVDNVDSVQKGLLQDYMATVFMSIEDLPNFKQLLSGEKDLDIAEAFDKFFAGEKIDSFPDDVQRVVHVLSSGNKKLFEDMRTYGVPVKKMGKYILKQVHKRDKVGALGIGAWKKKISTHGLDYARMFNIKDAEIKAKISSYLRDPEAYGGKIPSKWSNADKLALSKVNDFLDEAYDNIMYGKMDTQGVTDDLLEIGHTANYQSQLSAGRNIHFESTKAQTQYNMDLGSGSLLNGMKESIAAQARMLPLIRQFGSNPEAGLKGMMERIKSQLKRDGKMEAASKLEAKESAIMARFNILTGKNTKNTGSTLEKVGRGVRAVNTASLLGMSGIKSTSNFAVSASQMVNLNNKNYFHNLIDGLQNILNVSGKENRKQIAQNGGEFLNDMSYHMNEAMSMNDNYDGTKPGAMATLARSAYKWSGLDAVTEASRLTFTDTMRREVAKHVTTKFDKLPTGIQGEMLRANITSKDWDVFKHALTTDHQGRTTLSLEILENIEDVDIQPPMGMSREGYLREIGMKFRSYTQYKGDLASTTPGVHEMAKMRGDNANATIDAQVRATMFQFKSFGLQMWRIMGEAKNSNFDAEAMAKGKRNFGSNSSNMRLMAELSIGMAGMYYASQSLYKLAVGEEPDDPTSAATWANAWVQAGSTGFIGDFMLGQADSKYRSMAGDAIGPTFGGLVPNIANIYKNAFAGKNVSKDIVRLGRRVTPFQNNFLLDPFMDMMQYDVINEALDPGYAAKRDRRLKGK